MAPEAKPYKVRWDPSSTGWDVIDRATEIKIGHVFKYTGWWWVDNAGDFRNRVGTKQKALDRIWTERVEGTR